MPMRDIFAVVLVIIFHISVLVINSAENVILQIKERGVPYHLSMQSEAS